MRTEFIQDYDISKLAPADYNPRFLPDDKFAKLKKSITTLGIIKPLIINGDNGILTAGHQRTRAIKACGISRVPVIKIKGINKQDEIRFNLFHNSIETSKSKAKVDISGCKVGEYSVLHSDKILSIENNNPTIVKEICFMILRYGEWGSVVCDEYGTVILNNEYAVGAKLTNSDLIVYVLPKKHEREMFDFLFEEYGEYSYDALGIKSYNQLMCQMNRLNGGKREMRSSLYETYIVGKLDKKLSILDFGAGKCKYVDTLKRLGYDIHAYEPNFQNAKRNIDIKAVVGMIKDVEKFVKNNGLFDVVILDSVFNSLVSLQVEEYVACSCMAFLKKDGKFFTATRNLGAVLRFLDAKRAADKTRKVEFLDKNNFSATFRDGVWTMQHFHTNESLGKLLKKYFKNVETYWCQTGSQIYAIADTPIRHPEAFVREALEFELNMEYPHGYKHNRHKPLLENLIKLQPL